MFDLNSVWAVVLLVGLAMIGLGLFIWALREFDRVTAKNRAISKFVAANPGAAAVSRNLVTFEVSGVPTVGEIIAAKGKRRQRALIRFGRGNRVATRMVNDVEYING